MIRRVFPLTSLKALQNQAGTTKMVNLGSGVMPRQIFREYNLKLVAAQRPVPIWQCSHPPHLTTGRLAI